LAAPQQPLTPYVSCEHKKDGTGSEVYHTTSETAVRGKVVLTSSPKIFSDGLCLQDHLSTSLWSECVVYLGIGVFVKDPLSVDQQLPAFLHQFSQNQDPNGPRAKAILFDPEFRNKPPLCVEGGEWQEVNYNLFVKGNLLLVISNNWCDGQVEAEIVVTKEYRQGFMKCWNAT
jgi:hypothetical protein